MEKSTKRRAWVKNVVIIFLAVLLLLTFFSNTILNASLPEVSAQYPQYASLSSSVKVTGTVKANASYNVVYEEDEADAGLIQSRKVLSVYVKDGTLVDQGQVIMTLQGGPSSQLSDLQDQYDELKRAYDLSLLDDQVSGLESAQTLRSAERAVEDARKELAELWEERTAILSGGDTGAVLEAAVERLNDEIAALDEEISTLSGEIAALEGKIASAESQIVEDVLVKTSLEDRLALAEHDYAELEKQYNTLAREADFARDRLNELGSLRTNSSEASQLTAQIDALEKQIRRLSQNGNQAAADYSNALAAYTSYRNAHPGIEEEAASRRAELDDVTAQLNALEEARAAYESAAARLETAEDSLRTAQYMSTEAANTYAKALESGDDETIDAARRAKEEADSYLEMCRADVEYYELKAASAAADDPDDEELESLRAGYADALSAYNESAEILSVLEERRAAFEAAAAAAQNSGGSDSEELAELTSQLADLRAKLEILGMPEVSDVVDYAVQKEYEDAQKAYDEASAALSAVEADYNEAKSNVESLRRQSYAADTAAEYRVELSARESEMEGLNARRKELNKTLQTKQRELSNTSEPKTEEQIDREIADKQDLLSSLESSLAITRASQNRSNVSTTQERERQKKQMDELAAKIVAYQNAPATTEVTAPIAGRVISVYCVPGESVSSGATVATMEIADKGYVCEINMTAEEARKIQVGASCSVTNSWWYSNVSGTVSQIKPDPQSQGKNRIVVIEVTGDVSEGQEIRWAIGDKSRSYECVLPNSAIRDDNDGKYVLVVESKKTVLNVRYKAVRKPIEVIASDDTQTAVSGLYGSEFVITNATSPISDGQQVRLAGD